MEAMSAKSEENERNLERLDELLQEHGMKIDNSTDALEDQKSKLDIYVSDQREVQRIRATAEAKLLQFELQLKSLQRDHQQLVEYEIPRLTAQLATQQNIEDAGKGHNFHELKRQCKLVSTQVSH
jgi:hypothetical protein